MRGLLWVKKSLCAEGEAKERGAMVECVKCWESNSEQI